MSPRNPLTIGVITATHNRLSLLKRALASLEAQTYEHWMAIVVDDSNDSDTYTWWTQNQHDQRISYVRNDGNKGVGYSRNRALDLLLPRADFVTKLDDDDVVRPHSFQAAATAIQNYPDDRWFMSRHLDATTGESITRLNEPKTLYHYWSDVEVGNAVVGDRTFFIASDLIQSMQARFPENSALGGEWRFYAQLCRESSIRFFEGGETAGDYLADGLSSRQRKDIEFQTSELMDRFEFAASLRRSGEVRAGAERYLTRQVLRLLVHNAAAGSMRDAAPLLRKLDYRLALRSREFYTGAIRVGSAMVRYRTDSGKAGKIERTMIRTSRYVIGWRSFFFRSQKDYSEDVLEK